MKSWRKWGMRALALAMLLSLSAGPLAAVPRGGHSSGDETIDLLDGPGSVDFLGDPDLPYGRFEDQLGLLRSLRVRLMLGLRMALSSSGLVSLASAESQPMRARTVAGADLP